MSEVSARGLYLLLDSLRQRAFDVSALCAEVGLVEADLHHGRHIEWKTWVKLMDHIEQTSSIPLDQLFVRGAGMRSGHPFARIAQGVLSVRDLYTLVARWGVPRSFTMMRARFEPGRGRTARFVASFDSSLPGSRPSFLFMAGMLRELPALQGSPPAELTVTELTDHRAVFDLVLPLDRSVRSRVRRFMGALRNITTTLDEITRQGEELAHADADRRQQSLALREQDRWLDVALDAGRLGLWRWDPVTNQVRISGRFGEWLGSGVTEISAERMLSHIHPDDRAGLETAAQEALERGEPFHIEVRLHQSETTRWLRITGRTEVSSAGALYAYGSAADITTEKMLDTRIRMADRLIAAGTLAAGVAHEINNPLTYVLGNAELVQLRLEKHPAAAAVTKELIAQILDGVERIRSIVADIKAFARQDEGTIVPVDLQAACTAALRIVGAEVGHRATLVTQLEPDTPMVLANDAKLAQVIINLVVNASQAMPDRPRGENHIVVRTRRSPAGEAVLEVTDNGSGIPPEVMPRLFDPFFTTKPVGIGTGLGLSVCQGIIASFKGRIDVDSELGRGTCFRVTLPAAHAIGTTSVTGSAPRSRRESRLSVLVIDDEPLIREVVARGLASRGFSVHEAANGREGLSRALGDVRYDAIVCDLMMPDVDGALLYDTLGKQRPELATRLVFISGGAVTDRIRGFVSRPEIRVVHKPFELDTLVDTIERVAIAM